MVLCKFFKVGRCTWGNRCRDSHQKPARPAVRFSSRDSVCEFYVAGQCRFSANCKNTHEVKPSYLKPEAAPFVPSEIRPTRLPCQFFAEGRCKHGDACFFQHEEYRNPPELPISSPFSSFTRDLNGALATFKAGAEVESVKLPCDFSSIQLTNLPPDTQNQTVVDILAELGFTIPLSAIRVKPRFLSGSVATVKFDDPESATRLVEKFHQGFSGGGGGLCAKVVPPALKYGSQLQLNAVRCSWYRSFCKADIAFETLDAALAAQSALRANPRILDRSLYCSDPNKFRGRYNLRLTGLDINITEDTLSATLNDFQLPPASIKIHPPVHDLSDEKSAEFIRGYLSSVDEVVFFLCRTVKPGSNKICATAVYKDRSAAIKTLNILHQSTVPFLGYTAISLKRLISLKYNIPSEYAQIIERSGEFKSLQGIPCEHSTHVKMYSPNNASFATIRVFGSNEKAVSYFKACIEKLLAGQVLTNRDHSIWHPWFWTIDGQSYIRELSQKHRRYGVYIRVENSKSQILISSSTLCYKDHGEGVLKKELLDKIELLRKIKPDSPGTMDESREGDCVICFCTAENPQKTTCGHIYCQECFINQASTGDVPMTCQGEEAKCAHMFGIAELQDLLPLTALENLFQMSFQNHIQNHPKDFHFCPTPDCSSIHRPTADGTVVTCNVCLNEICTTCNAVSHRDLGIDCKKWKEIYEGDVGVRKWMMENGGKQCPNCQTGIEKFEGCNHVNCPECHKHICWACLQIYETSDECYVHMNAEHAGYYDADDPNNPDNFNGEEE